MLSNRPAGAKARRAALAAAAALLAATTGGCATLDYYRQAIGGQYEVLAARRDIAALVNDPATPPQKRARLEYALAAREFASRALALPDNGSYRRYAELGRPYVVWNVFVAPELALEPQRWCFPFAGCVAYRGYFAHADAEAFAQEQRAAGHDTYVGGVAAYSTLGWFDDPLLDTILRRPDPEVAGLIFHELAHQRVYLADDSELNESFATAVELEGVRRWLEQRGNAAALAAYRTRLARRSEFTQLLLDCRAQLARLYAGDAGDEAKRAAKRAAFAALRADYQALKARWGGYDGFDAFMHQELNNAHLASVGTYHRHVAALQALLAREGGDLARFYAAVEALGRRPKTEREAALAALAAAS